METRFSEISHFILKELTKKEVNIEELQKEIPFLPQRLRRSSVGRQTSDIGKIFAYLDANIWNFIDYGLLAAIIDLYGSEQLKENMENFERDVSVFEQQTTLSQLTEYWPGRQHIPREDLQCDITFRIRKNPDKCLLEQLRFLRKEFCDQFLPPKSELSMLYGSFTYGSLVIKLYIPIDLIPDLVTGVNQPGSASFFVSREIESFHIRDVSMYQGPKAISSQFGRCTETHVK